MRYGLNPPSPSPTYATNSSQDFALQLDLLVFSTKHMAQGKPESFLPPFVTLIIIVGATIGCVVILAIMLFLKVCSIRYHRASTTFSTTSDAIERSSYVPVVTREFWNRFRIRQM
ncbi:uncharacterized protein BT62DRAFT_1013961 [Guyanagaster necrorhizus]|uniref:Uncharacterized protein n=1 Tax=Guyanagaster necrorhizus TaxID=856835 RepID=A0A9P7VG91_9AGAR|nr:uncharacterized protein BT62DRAFT_1013961 [Guyanagaster necrorhizus MCA 3950]KAG7439439.1 hypothetical protein BT62DRAFT_1013961 [Guyanagaster necrorhizus MCA 3950]